MRHVCGDPEHFKRRNINRLSLTKEAPGLYERRPSKFTLMRPKVYEDHQVLHRDISANKSPSTYKINDINISFSSLKNMGITQSTPRPNLIKEHKEPLKARWFGRDWLRWIFGSESAKEINEEKLEQLTQKHNVNTRRLRRDFPSSCLLDQDSCFNSCTFGDNSFPPETKFFSLMDIECNNSNGLRSSQRVRSTQPRTSSGISGRIIHVEGDGRCLFRSLVTGLSPDLQQTRRDDFGSPLRKEDSNYETLMSDALRAKVIRLMLDNAHFYLQLDQTVLNADTPIPVGYSHFRERLNDMTLTSTMPGDLELNAISTALERQVLVLDVDLRPIVVYGRERFPSSQILTVRYTRLGTDVGHYDAVIPDLDTFVALDFDTMQQGDGTQEEDEEDSKLQPYLLDCFKDLLLMSKNNSNDRTNSPGNRRRRHKSTSSRHNVSTSPHQKVTSNSHQKLPSASRNNISSTSRQNLSNDSSNSSENLLSASQQNISSISRQNMASGSQYNTQNASRQNTSRSSKSRTRSGEINGNSSKSSVHKAIDGKDKIQNSRNKEVASEENKNESKKNESDDRAIEKTQHDKKEDDDDVDQNEDVLINENSVFYPTEKALYITKNVFYVTEKGIDAIIDNVVFENISDSYDELNTTQNEKSQKIQIIQKERKNEEQNFNDEEQLNELIMPSKKPSKRKAEMDSGLNEPKSKTQKRTIRDSKSRSSVASKITKGKSKRTKTKSRAIKRNTSRDAVKRSTKTAGVKRRRSASSSEEKTNTNNSKQETATSGEVEKRNHKNDNEKKGSDPKKDSQTEVDETQGKQSSPTSSSIQHGTVCFLCKKPTPVDRSCIVVCTMCSRVAHKDCAVPEHTDRAGEYFLCKICYPG